MTNGKASTIKFIGWITIVCGIIGSFVFASMFPILTTIGVYSTYVEETYNWLYAITGVIASIIIGIVFIGFAEIIELLQLNLDNSKKITDFLVSTQQNFNTNEENCADLPEL